MNLSDHLKIGFIGFGEAGSQIARGLRGAGVSYISAFDINSNTPGLGQKIQQRARENEVALLESNAELSAASDILLSTVTANRAAEAAEQTAVSLRAQQIYADLNSISPKLKQSIGQLIEARGGRFVEAAIMSPVSSHGHRVPMLLGGPHAQAFANALERYGMRLE